ncbi:MAG: Arm DNA-binding domain-containing protein, partial [Bacteroidota bacterium]
METFTLHFYIKKEKARKDGSCPIYARVTVNRKRSEIALKRFVQPIDWNQHAGKPIGRRPFHKELATYLEAFRTKMYRHHREILDRGDELTAKALKEAFTGKAKHKGKTLIEVFEFHNHR